MKIVKTIIKYKYKNKVQKLRKIKLKKTKKLLR